MSLLNIINIVVFDLEPCSLVHTKQWFFLNYVSLELGPKKSENSAIRNFENNELQRKLSENIKLLHKF